MDYPGTQDCDINSTDPTFNSGQAHNLICGSYLESSRWRGLIAFDLESFDDDHPSATLVGATLKFYVEDLG